MTYRERSVSNTSTIKCKCEEDLQQFYEKVKSRTTYTLWKDTNDGLETDTAKKWIKNKRICTQNDSFPSPQNYFLMLILFLISFWVQSGIILVNSIKRFFCFSIHRYMLFLFLEIILYVKKIEQKYVCQFNINSFLSSK